MYGIAVRNVNQALAQGLELVERFGVEESSRNGRVLVMDEPVVTKYARPMERVLFSGVRDANPFFHFMEGLWMLAGRSDVAFPRYFNKRFIEYSDDGESLHGAYGNRWRHYFGIDQLWRIINMLRDDRTSRRAVLTMWDAAMDLGGNSRDLPCNTHIYFRIKEDALDMTVCCRSNDLLWGAYGANAVHMSMLQEFLSAAIGVRLGDYHQFSNNFHLYLDVEAVSTPEARNLMTDNCHATDYYTGGPYDVAPMPMVRGNYRHWMDDLNSFMGNPLQPTMFMDKFFTDTAIPMFTAWHERKSGQGDGLAWAEKIEAPDWRLACTQWIMRRMK